MKTSQPGVEMGQLFVFFYEKVVPAGGFVYNFNGRSSISACFEYEFVDVFKLPFGLGIAKTALWDVLNAKLCQITNIFFL